MLRACAFLATLVAARPIAAQSCPELAGALRIESDRYLVFYRTRPDRLAVGQHFAMDVVVCPRRAGLAAPESLRIDARMPEHRHAMNYRTTVKPREGAGYVAEGFLFHMPGRWEFVFEMSADGRTDRATRGVVLD